MRCVVVLTLLALAPAAAFPQGPQPRLGRIDFPTSGSGVAQEHFILGVLYLHSFEYASARDAFRAAQEADSGFVMAYWGEAMTRNHPVWNRRYRSQALAALARLAPTTEGRLAAAPTERERMYLLAVETLFAEGPKAGRDTAYAFAMQDVMFRYPDDLEARAFYALALLGLNQGVRDYGSYMKAGALAGDIRRVNPDHPGGAHYTIHAFDDALHAPLGLQAAWAYSDIAPAAPHALHMTSHIFLAMGMWDQVVARNQSAVELTSRRPGHYTAWLNYGLLQQGRYRDAVDLLVAVWANVPDDANPGMRRYLAWMRAQYIIDTGRWDDPILGWDIDLTGVDPSGRAIDAFTHGYAALETGRRETAGHYLGLLTTMLDSVETSGQQGVVEVLQLELESQLLLDAGQLDQALLAARKATRIEDGLPLEFGPPEIVKPSHELLGEMLLGLNRPTEAMREFQAALALAPKRSQSLSGLSIAAEKAGDFTAGARAGAQLDLVWHQADPQVREQLTRH